MSLVHIHALHIRPVLQRDHIGSVLVELQKIAAVLIEEGEMRGHDDLPSRDRSAGRNGYVIPQLYHPRVLINAQAPGKARGKAQRVELGLVGEAHRPDNLQGQGQAGSEVCLEAQLVQGLQLQVDFAGVIQAIYISVLFGKAAGNVSTQGFILRQGLLVGLQVHAGLLQARAL